MLVEYERFSFFFLILFNNNVLLLGTHCQWHVKYVELTFALFLILFSFSTLKNLYELLSQVFLILQQVLSPSNHFRVQLSLRDKRKGMKGFVLLCWSGEKESNFYVLTHSQWCSLVLYSKLHQYSHYWTDSRISSLFM